MSDLPLALKQAYARSKTSTRHLIALELEHPTLPGGYLRLINYDRDISVSGSLYVGMAMVVREPEVGTDPDNKIKIRIDGTPGTFQFYINRALVDIDGPGIVYGTIRPIAYNTSTNSTIGVAGTFKFKVVQAEYDMTACVLTLGHVSPTNMPFPNKKYSAATHPYLYR